MLVFLQVLSIQNYLELNLLVHCLYDKINGLHIYITAMFSPLLQMLYFHYNVVTNVCSLLLTYLNSSIPHTVLFVAYGVT